MFSLGILIGFDRIQMVCSLVLTGTGLVYGYYGCFINDGCNGYYIMLLGRAGLWMATYVR